MLRNYGRFQDRLYTANEDFIAEQTIQRVHLTGNAMLRDYLIFCISDSMVLVTLKDTVIKYCTVYFINIGDYAERVAGVTPALKIHYDSLN